MAIALGPIVGGWLLQHFSWASIFFAMAPVAALAAALVAYSVPTSRDPSAPTLDRRGFALSTVAMALLIYAIIEAPGHGWSSARSLAGFALAAALLGAFVAWERRVAEPMLDVRLFRNLRFTAACGSVTVAFFSLFGFIFLMTQYFQFIKHYGPLSAGVHLLPVATSVGVASVIGTKLAVRLGTKLIVTSGLVMVAAFYAWVATASASTAYSTIAAQMVIYGVGMGLTSAPATEAIMGVVSTEKAGVGSAVNDTTRLLGGTLGVAVIGSVYASLYGSRLSTGLPAHLPAALARVAHTSVGSALGVAEGLVRSGRPLLAAGVQHAASGAFIHGLSVGCLVAGAVATAGAVMAAVLLPSFPSEGAHALGGPSATPHSSSSAAARITAAPATSTRSTLSADPTAQA
jgi:predicted MFS family arabinose efflux permease